MIIQTPEELFDEALKQVESKSIREWAEKQRDVWIKYGATPIFNSNKPDKVARMHLMIVAEAIGLW